MTFKVEVRKNGRTVECKSAFNAALVRMGKVPNVDSSLILVFTPKPVPLSIPTDVAHRAGLVWNRNYR
jgi:hypothetical protein